MLTTAQKLEKRKLFRGPRGKLEIVTEATLALQDGAGEVAIVDGADRVVVSAERIEDGNQQAAAAVVRPAARCVEPVVRTPPAPVSPAGLSSGRRRG